MIVVKLKEVREWAKGDKLEILDIHYNGRGRWVWEMKLVKETEVKDELSSMG